MLVLLQGQAGLKGDGDAAEVFEAREEAGIERAAVAGEGEQLRRVVRVLRGEHAGGSGGGLRAEGCWLRRR